MKITFEDIAFCTVIGGLGAFGVSLLPDIIGDDFFNATRPDIIVHEGEIFTVEPSTQHYASIVGGELIIWDSKERAMIDNAHIISENFETPGERLGDYLTNGDPHVGDVVYRIGEDGPVQRTSIVSTFPSGSYYVQTSPLRREPTL
ncbi:MAG: hypothetical protein AAF549_07935 [Pseudomonadota bacterium]